MTALADRVVEVLAGLDVPAPPTAELAEFDGRYAAGMRAVGRYAGALAAVAGDQAAHDRLVAVWPAIRLRVDRLGRLCQLGVTGGSARQWHRHKSDHRRGQSLRQQTLHEVHRTLVKVEGIVDKAVAMAIAVVMAADDPGSAARRADVDTWVRALTDALRELDSDPDD